MNASLEQASERLKIAVGTEAHAALMEFLKEYEKEREAVFRRIAAREVYSAMPMQGAR